MKHYVIIPAHNEEAFLGQLLESIDKQTRRPERVVVVDDNSTDRTPLLLERYCREYTWCSSVRTEAAAVHLPGMKVINAFNAGLETLDEDYDLISKLDADLELPRDYFEQVIRAFQDNDTLGISGGYIQEQDSRGQWVLRHPMSMDHVRGALKSYRKQCFQAMEGLRNDIGWDTVDELLAQYHGYQVAPVKGLFAKHFRPLGAAYGVKARMMQGRAMYTMRYGLMITLIASLKMAWKHRNPLVFLHNMQGYFRARDKQSPRLVTEEEGRFIRALRWRKIRSKLF